ncbi:CYP2K [Acanthosepion pharaonis]|uniref:CYP2K n=1 Tax=Acanthosepion pharaonis TaxID=158019 RepID=A0A812B209_ACAPH|nr:CYP2K [Sepia pharaonis]
MEDRIHEEVKAFVEVLDSSAAKPLDIHDLVQTAVANVICSLMFGRRFDYNNPQFKKYVRGIDENFKNIGLSAIVNFFPMLEHLPGDPTLRFRLKVVRSSKYFFLSFLLLHFFFFSFSFSFLKDFFFSSSFLHLFFFISSLLFTLYFFFLFILHFSFFFLFLLHLYLTSRVYNSSTMYRFSGSDFLSRVISIYLSIDRSLGNRFISIYISIGKRFISIYR